MQAKEGAFKSAGAASVLSAERWKEMDWDDDGTITFKEFFWAFQGWISAEDEDAQAVGVARKGLRDHNCAWPGIASNVAS